MKAPSDIYLKLKNSMKQEWKIAFLASFIMGILIHLPMMLSDVPNHDGLDSMYFDQNMITSGRWFLTVACGFSSYYSLPWMISLLSVFYLACTSVVLTELLELKKTYMIILASGLLVSFPALASTFAYVFTMDGYMLAVFLAVLSVLLTKKYRLGFWAGAVCLAFSMGIYQAYLPFAVLLSIYSIVIHIIEPGKVREKIHVCCKYLYMGVLGGGLYFVILQVLLKIQGKHLASYQGINGIAGGDGAARNGILSTIKEMYGDFVGFTFGNNILGNNFFAYASLILLVGMAAYTFVKLCFNRKWWKNPVFFVIIGLLLIGLPIATNIIMLVSPNVTYHLLMRYQWILYPILLLAFCHRYGNQEKAAPFMQWGMLLVGSILIFNYGVTDNIGYFNLQKRYEKTYAYCVRLLDRIEQTEGYYQGIPIAMIGVVGDEEYPLTDVTGNVTASMIGVNGDSLLYTGTNYEAFMQHYLGATLNFMDAEVMAEIYYSEEYIAMDTFPGAESTKVVDGVLYVKTENTHRD